MRYLHTNIIAQDWRRVSEFYIQVLGCKIAPPERNLKGEWIDKLTGIQNVHIEGVHLILPGYKNELPTLEIFSYNAKEDNNVKPINRLGFAHIAFEVESVEDTLKNIIDAGGGQIGEIVKTKYPNNKIATFVYATDIEGNIIELQSWE